MANLNKNMFREYDLRGELKDDQLNEQAIEIIAKAYGTMLRQKDIDVAVVGHDYREGSEQIMDIAIQGLTSTGVNVIELGMILTPMMYSAQYHFKSRGGMMVTASHNPSGWSGFKLALGYSYTFGPSEMAELYELTDKEQFAVGSGTVRSEDFLPAYTEDVINRVELARPLRVVVNAGNGTPGPIAAEILHKAGCTVEELYCDLDWNFPHYFPNPSRVEMMEDTGKKVRDTKADIGFAIDGDGDRLGVTDELGHIVWADRFLIPLSREVIEKHPGTKIVFDVKCSQALPEDIQAHGGVPVMWKTGHSYIKQKLWEEKAALGGEMSGHVFFGEPVYYGFDDAVFAALKLAEFVSHSQEPLSVIMDQTPQYISTPPLQVKCPVDEKYDESVKYEIVEKLTKDFQEEAQKHGIVDINVINGARINFGDGWGLVRASSNLPVLGMRFEARTQERVDELKAIFREKFAKYPEIGSEWESG